MPWGTLCNVASDPLTATGDVWPASSAEGTPGGCGAGSSHPEAVAGSSHPEAVAGSQPASWCAEADAAADAASQAVFLSWMWNRFVHFKLYSINIHFILINLSFY